MFFMDLKYAKLIKIPNFIILLNFLNKIFEIYIYIYSI